MTPARRSVLLLVCALALPLASAAAPADLGAEELMRRGRQALDAQRWNEAADLFRRAASHAGEGSDAATFWHAYAERRAGRDAVALALAERLARERPQSPWVDDARSLAAEIRGRAGEVGGAAGGDELYALIPLVRQAPAEAVERLERFLAADPGEAAEERALFLLAQVDHPRARRSLAAAARDGSSPRRQRQAVATIAADGLPGTGSLLRDVYASSDDADVKAAVLEGHRRRGDVDDLAAVARQEEDEDLRRHAVLALGRIVDDGARRALASLYAEGDLELRRDALEAFYLRRDVDSLVDVARNDPDAGLRRAAKERLVLLDAPEAVELIDPR